MASQCDTDWQSTKKTVLQRNCHMFNNPLMSDIKFTCGESKRKYFYAHKYVLATSSAVFYAMFYGDLAQKDTIIHLPDTDEESLEEFLRFLYTDHSFLTADNAFKVLYLAEKYIVPSLTKECVDIMEESLQPDNAFIVLEQAQVFAEKKLEKKCWEVVEQQTTQVVTSEAFVDIGQDTLTNLLKRDTLDVSEVELFKAVVKWSDHQCRKRSLEATGKNRREIIGDAIYEIDFQSMSKKELTKYVTFSGLLTQAELLSVYYVVNDVGESDSRWKPVKRRTQKRRFTRFFRSDIRVPLWSSGGSKPDCLRFCVNKPTKFHGVYMFGDANGSDYKVSLKVNDVEVLRDNFTSEENDGVYGFNVMLPSAIALDQNQTVTLAAMTTGPLSFIGVNGKSSVTVDGVTVTFSDAPTGTRSNETNKTEGQFFQIILSERS